MRKFNLYCIVALVGAMVLSLSSCTKDLEDDVDALKKEVAANKDAIKSIQDAISKGSVITNVETVPGGFKITFSDGKSINVTNGVDGAAGAAGAAGADGAPGLPGAIGNDGKDAYAPVIKINEAGNWVVQTVKDGEFEEILVDGKPVSAKGQDGKPGGDGTDCGLGVNEDGFITIDGIATSIGTPSVVKNEGNNTILITIWDSNLKRYETYTLPLYVEGAGVTFLSSAFPENQIIIAYGVAKKAITDGPFADLGITADKVLMNGHAFVIVNPSNVNVLPANFSFETVDKKTLPIVVTGFKRGMDDFIPKTKAVGSGLATLTLGVEQTATEIEAFVKEYTTDDLPVALKYSNSASDEIYSKFELALDLTKNGKLTINKPMSAFTAKIGKEFDFTSTEALSFDTELLYASRVVLTDKFKDLASHFDFTAKTITAKTTPEAIAALRDKEVEFYFTAIDYNGESAAYPNGIYNATKEIVVKVVFRYSPTEPSYTLDAAPLVIKNNATAAEKTTTASFDKLFEALGETETAKFRQASGFSSKIQKLDDQGAVITKDYSNNGFVRTFIKADGNNANAGNMTAMKFVADYAKVSAGRYKVTTTFKNPAVGSDAFDIITYITVTNDASLKIEKVKNKFVGNATIVYGATQQTPASNSYDLTKSYEVIDGVVLSFQQVDDEGNLVALDDDGIVKLDGKTFNIPLANINKSYTIRVTGTILTNSENVLTEDILVTPRSAIANPLEVKIDATKAKLVYKNGTPDSFNLSSVITKFVDAENKEIVLFGMTGNATPTLNTDARIKSIKVENVGDNKALIKITETSASSSAKQDFAVSVVYDNDGILFPAECKIKVTITDQYDQTVVKEIVVKVDTK